MVGIASAGVMSVRVAGPGQGLDKWRLTRPRRSIVSASVGLDQIYGGDEERLVTLCSATDLSNTP